MVENFTFDVNTSIEAIDKVLNIAENLKDEIGFTGKLASELIGLKGLINKADYINLLNEQLITCRKFNGLKLERVWDGGFQNFQESDNVIRLHRLALFFSVYLKEFSFRRNFRIDVGHDLYNLISLVRNNRHEFIERSAWCLDLLDDLPTFIMQEEFHSEHAIAISKILKSTDIDKVGEFIQTKDESISKIDKWNNEFQSKLDVVNILKDKLDTYQTAFNFVGLYQGFDSLKREKEKLIIPLEKKYSRFAAGILVIPILELIWILFNYEFLASNLNILGFLALPTISIIIILFYFLRVCLTDLKSYRSQVMQLELRMTLCQFIQSYAEKSKELKENNKEGFEKFENLIFSSIVSSDENIPSTFDGMEHISNLLKNFKSNS